LLHIARHLDPKTGRWIGNPPRFNRLQRTLSAQRPHKKQSASIGGTSLELHGSSESHQPTPTPGDQLAIVIDPY
jgi:hypothetical protein